MLRNKQKIVFIVLCVFITMLSSCEKEIIKEQEKFNPELVKLKSITLGNEEFEIGKEALDIEGLLQKSCYSSPTKRGFEYTYFVNSISAIVSIGFVTLDGTVYKNEDGSILSMNYDLPNGMKVYWKLEDVEGGKKLEYQIKFGANELNYLIRIKESSI